MIIGPLLLEKISRLSYIFMCKRALFLLEAFGESMSVAKPNDLEHRALRLIVSLGDQGVLQSDLWRKLGATSREGSRISLKLENKGLIRREQELSNGRWTYRLYPKRRSASIDSVLTCPCLTCPDDSRCGALGAISPNDCEKLTDWILTLA